MIYAELSNPKRPDEPHVTVTFPITENVYDRLESIGIGSATERDCYVATISGDVPILKRLEKIAVNIDELDYLAKRLDSFDRCELAQFQGTAVSHGYFDMTDFINLTFCCQGVTVVQDFSDLNAIGREHYMALHGCIPVDELKSIDFRKIALSLLLNEEGKVTPYGVVYDNGMRLEQLYDGYHFPDYVYSSDTILTAAVTNKIIPEDIAPITWLHLPMVDCQIGRAMQRGGIAAPEDMRVRYSDIELPSELNGLLTDDENLHVVNELCLDFVELDSGNREKFGAALGMVQPSDLSQARNLLNQLELFDFIPNISTPMEYGRFMIAESGHFEYDENLDEFYDFERYGKWRMSQEQGKFVDSGYISYHGFISIEEVLEGCESERMDQTMGM